MNGIFENVMQNNQEWCTDHLLEIIYDILHMASEVKKKGSRLGLSAYSFGFSVFSSKNKAKINLSVLSNHGLLCSATVLISCSSFRSIVSN